MPVRELYASVTAEVKRTIIGQEQTIAGAMVALLSGGHALLEGVPGTAKTLLIRTLARTLRAEFKRVQFTPDLMPSDVTGSMILREGDLVFRRGPIFTHLLLGDEINRAPAKTQSALLEAMQERAVTSDGNRFPLPEHFTVFATQNPIEHEGTYPLPEAELDRFMLMIEVDYPSADEEKQILALHHDRKDGEEATEARVDLSELAAAKEEARSVKVAPPLVDYAARFVRETRAHPSVVTGASPRAGIHLLRAAKAWAAIEGRDYAIADDVKRWARDVLRHRLVLSPGAEIQGTTTDDVIGALLDEVAVPA